MFTSWPPIFTIEPNCQMSVIVNDLPVHCADQSVAGVAAGNHNNNQQQGYTGGYVLPETADPPPLQSLPQQMTTSLNVASVQRVARPILGAAANLGLPPGYLEKTGTVANMLNDSKGPVIGAAVAMTVDVIPQSTRPPSNSENIPNGRHWPPAADSPSCMRSVSVPPPSSSPSMMHQQPQSLPTDTAAANLSHQFIAPPYCFIAPAAAASSTTGVSISVSTAVPQAAGPASSLCAAGCCHCGHCQRNPPPVGAYTYAYPPFMIPGAAPFLPGFGYALPGLPFPPPSLAPVSYSGAYTQSSEMVYNNPPVFTFMHQFQRPPPLPAAPLPNPGRGLPPKPSPVVTVPYNPLMPPPSAHVANPSSRRNGTKNSSCFNCGLVGHQASMCPDPLISSSTHIGTNSLLAILVQLPPCFNFFYLSTIVCYCLSLMLSCLLVQLPLTRVDSSLQIKQKQH